LAATIVATVTQTGFSNASKTYTFAADNDVIRMIAAYQVEANASVNATATRNQVLAYIFDTVLVKAIKAKVKQNETVVTLGVEPVIT
jgi:heterodisulfide reductase subunit B